jgi:hypothetical protein
VTSPPGLSIDVAAHTSMIGSRWAKAFQVPAENCRVVCAPTIEASRRQGQSPHAISRGVDRGRCPPKWEGGRCLLICLISSNDRRCNLIANGCSDKVRHGALFAESERGGRWRRIFHPVSYSRRGRIREGL